MWCVMIGEGNEPSQGRWMGNFVLPCMTIFGIYICMTIFGIYVSIYVVLLYVNNPESIQKILQI